MAIPKPTSKTRPPFEVAILASSCRKHESSFVDSIFKITSERGPACNSFPNAALQGVHQYRGVLPSSPPLLQSTYTHPNIKLQNTDKLLDIYCFFSNCLLVLRPWYPDSLSLNFLEKFERVASRVGSAGQQVDNVKVHKDDTEKEATTIPRRLFPDSKASLETDRIPRSRERDVSLRMKVRRPD